ncbi:2-phospho-L-lactate transferase [Cupriavidus sp. 8B]
MSRKILLLSGGVGGAKLAEGMAQVVPPDDLTIVVNTGDDFRHLGLKICPDLDSVLYMLAGLASSERGWGRTDETWNCMDALRQLGPEAWFQLGDRDIALHLHRSIRLANGDSLESVTAEVASRLGVRHRILPMTEGRVNTWVESGEERYAFQDYFVRMRCEPRVTGIDYEGADDAVPTPEFRSALEDPQLGCIVIAPSNPVLSIGPILALPRIRSTIKLLTVPVIAVSPIINGAAVKGPAAKILQELGMGASAEAVARYYGQLVDYFVVAPDDAGNPWDCSSQRRVANILMSNAHDRRSVAQTCIDIMDAHFA